MVQLSGTDRIASDFDLYILCGLGLHIAHALAVRQEHSFPQIVKTRLKETLAITTLTKLRACSEAPIAVMPAPCQPRKYATDFEALPPGESRRIATVFTEACRQLAAAHHALFIPQPKETLAVNWCSTKMKFARRRRHGQGSAEDRFHTTGEYGAIVMRRALRFLPLSDSGIAFGLNSAITEAKCLAADSSPRNGLVSSPGRAGPTVETD
ncbi:MAG TPA: hypothetical protein VGG10_18605 [Rhizomicrobium sp.]|jgi:hypothetical protein